MNVALPVMSSAEFAARLSIRYEAGDWLALVAGAESQVREAAEAIAAELSFLGIPVRHIQDPVDAAAIVRATTSAADQVLILSASSAGAAYVFRRSQGSTWVQEAYVKASNTGAADDFGNVVSLSGDTLAVAAEKEASNATGTNGSQGNDLCPFSGAVYVFRRFGGAWAQEAYAKASNTEAQDMVGFGAGMALAGSALMLGARPGVSSSGTRRRLDAELQERVAHLAKAWLSCVRRPTPPHYGSACSHSQRRMRSIAAPRGASRRLGGRLRWASSLPRSPASVSS